MNILHVVNSIEVGGAEIFLLRLIRYQESVGNKCYVLIVDPTRNDDSYLGYWRRNTNAIFLDKYIEPINLGVKVRYKLASLFNLISKGNQIVLLKEHLKNNYYKNIINKYSISIINSHLLSADFFVYHNFIPATNIPWVLTSQGCYNSYDNLKELSKIIPHIDGMTYVANKNLKFFQETGIPLTKNKRLVYNALPISQSIKNNSRNEWNLSDEDFIVGQICRSIPEKGMEITIKAVNNLNNKGYFSIKLILCGTENSYYNQLKEKYQSKNILFLGEVREPTTYIELFDIGVLPTYFPSESCPSTIAEYLVCGKPVISTDRGEIPKMIKYESQQAGIIIDALSPKGIPDYIAFSEAILNYYLDKQKLKMDSETAKKAAKKFDIRITGEEYNKIYKTAIQLVKDRVN